MTVYEHYEGTKNLRIGAPDLLAPRRARICAITFEGLPFGEHFVDEARYVESDMLANVLVACGVDREVKNIAPL